MKNVFSIIWKVVAVAMICVGVYLLIQVMGEAENVIDSYEQLTGNSIGATNSIKIAFLRDYIKHTGNTDILVTLGITPVEKDLILKDSEFSGANPEDDRQNSGDNNGNTGDDNDGSGEDDDDSDDNSDDDDEDEDDTTDIPTDVKELLDMLLACGIAGDSGDANCNKVFKILYPKTSETYTSLKPWSTSTKNKIEQLNKDNLKSVSVKVWQFKNYSPTSTNMDKVEKTISITCASTLEPLVKQIFDEIHDSSDKPVIMCAGGLCVRKMNNSSGKSVTSTHSYGGTLDINYSAGGQNVTWNWNGGRGSAGKPYPVTKSAWDSLPESQYKYLCLYDSCTIVKTFEKYGFYWGGKWSSGSCDPMHFSVFNH